MHTIDWERSIAHLGYWLSTDMQGRGIASEAVRWITNFGINTLGLDYLDISSRNDNERSKLLAERCGFTYMESIEDSEWVAGPNENEDPIEVPLAVYIRTTPFRKPRLSLDEARPNNFYSRLTGPSRGIHII